MVYQNLSASFCVQLLSTPLSEIVWLFTGIEVHMVTPDPHVDFTLFISEVRKTFKAS